MHCIALRCIALNCIALNPLPAYFFGIPRAYAYAWHGRPFRSVPAFSLLMVTVCCVAWCAVLCCAWTTVCVYGIRTSTRHAPQGASWRSTTNYIYYAMHRQHKTTHEQLPPPNKQDKIVPCRFFAVVCGRQINETGCESISNRIDRSCNTPAHQKLWYCIVSRGGTIPNFLATNRNKAKHCVALIITQHDPNDTIRIMFFSL